jgi:hypothetical protein
MDFANRGTRPVGTEPVVTGQHSTGNKGSKMKNNKMMKMLFVAFLFLLTALLVCLIIFFAIGSKDTESSFIKKDKYQAVFLNGGQVYFGKIGQYNNRYLTLTDIYYLRVNQQVQPGQTAASNDVSLAKLGNELHGPDDSMVINRTEVQFWENLKNDGQVVKAITAYKANPSAATTGTTQQSSGNQQQTNTTPTTPTVTPPATTKKQ